MRPYYRIFIACAILIVILTAAYFYFSVREDADTGLAPANVYMAGGISGAGRGSGYGVVDGAVKGRIAAPVNVRIIDGHNPIFSITVLDAALYIAGGLLLFFISVWSISLGWKKLKSLSIPTPFEEARKQVGLLKKDAARGNQTSNEICRRLSLVVRNYVRQEFGVGGPQATTSELLAGLARVSDRAPDGICESARRVLSVCDMAKFSGYVPSEKEMNECIASADDIMEKINNKILKQTNRK